MTFAGLIAFVAWRLSAHPNELTHSLPELAPWVALLAAVNLIPVPVARRVHIAADYPIATAAALVLSPLEACLVCFIGSFDANEFGRHGYPVGLAVFNRSQVAIGYGVGSLVAHRFAPAPATSVRVLMLAFLALATNVTINGWAMAMALAVRYGVTPREAIRRFRTESLLDLSLAYITWGFVAAMLTALYDQIHAWALLAVIPPTLLARQTLDRSQTLAQTSKAYRAREAALAELGKRIGQERADERRLIAADLHDEVLPPLFKVTLMAHVLKGELARGQLLELDEDLPELTSAAEAASNRLREMVGDLRQSALGRGGLDKALSGLARELSRDDPSRFHVSTEATSIDPHVELVLYQVAKEALTNAATHSGARNIWLELATDGDHVRLIIRDDGIGFDPYQQPTNHYGLLIMRERASSINAFLSMDSEVGTGTVVTVLTHPASADQP